MDRAETQERQVETQATVEEAQSNDPSPPSSQDRTGPNRLLYQIRSMPLVSLLLGRNVPARNVINDTNSFFLLKCIMGFHLVILVTLVGLSAFTIYYYNIRFYKTQTRPSETLIVCWLLRGIWRTVNSSWSLRYYCAGVETTPNLKLSQTFYNLVSILWIGLAVIFLGVSPKEDLKSVSSKICYFLLWTTIASYVVPMLAYTLMCFLLYMTLFIVIYFRHGSVPLSSGAMPLGLLRKLKVQKYREVLKTINMSENINKLVCEEGIGENANNLDVISPITIDDPLSDCVNNSELLAERICSICILKISDDDKVFLLPCDMRHLFHRDCLRKWFKRSSECPICRSNISEILTEKNKPTHKGSIEPPQPMEYSEQYDNQDPIQELGHYPVHESDYSHSEKDEEQDQQEQIEELKKEYDEHDKDVFQKHSQGGNDDNGKSISMSNEETNENNKQSVDSSNGDFIVVVDNVAVDVIDPVDHKDSVYVGVKEAYSEHMMADETVKEETSNKPINEESNESLEEKENESSNVAINETPNKPMKETTAQPPKQPSKEDIIFQKSSCGPDEKLQNSLKQVEKEHEEKSEEQDPLEVVIVEEEKEIKLDAVESSVKNDPIL